MFLLAGSHLGVDGASRLPTHAVGEHSGPAFMSRGRAISMFGIPEDPGDDPISESDETTTLPGELQSCSITPPATDEETGARAGPPRTEREHRDRDKTHPPTVSTLPEALQWELLGPEKYGPYTALLANKYLQLAKMKTSETEVASSEDSKEGPAKQSTNSGPWPAVGKPDFAGFTKWITDCEKTWPGSEFGSSVLPQWKSDCEQRNKTIAAKLRAATQNLQITDASLGMIPPSTFNSQFPLLEKDLEALGIKATQSKD